jgi:hypothetical protein
MDDGGRSQDVTRRQFVALDTLGGAALAAGCGSKASGGWEFLRDAQATTLKAICDQIIPKDDYPSASEAGVLNYIDRQLVRHYRPHQGAYRDWSRPKLKAASDLERQSPSLARRINWLW